MFFFLLPVTVIGSVGISLAEVDRYSANQFIYKKNPSNSPKPILCHPPNRRNPPTALFNQPI